MSKIEEWKSKNPVVTAYGREIDQLIQIVRDECKQELLDSSSVMIHPHIEGVFAVIEQKALEAKL
jgi:hypothetical protein